MQFPESLILQGMKDLINERSFHRILYQREDYQQLMGIEITIIHFNAFLKFNMSL